MPTEFISNDVTVTGPGNAGRLLGDTDLLVVRTTGSLTSVDGLAVLMTDGASLRVQGMVFKQNSDIPVIRTEGLGGSTIDVMEGGSIFCARDNNVVVSIAAFATINNAGSIVGDAGAGISASAGMILNNSGQIFAADAAVEWQSTATAGTIVNSGVIRGGTGPGSALEDGHAIIMGNTAATIVNTGTIESLGAAGHGILVVTDAGTAGTMRIENHGTIRSLAATGINASANIRDGMFITNTGLITGLTRAIEGSAVKDTIINSGVLAVLGDGLTGVRLGSGDDVLRNRGVIEARVDMGIGADFFDGRFSDQGDYVFGGAGNDGLLGGALNDSLYGGADNDRIFGGAGDDELIDSDGLDTIYGGLGDDVIAVAGSLDGMMFGGQGDDRIEGSFGDDTLSGGAGDDTLVGAGGDDVYDVNSLLDLVIEVAAGGTADVVQSGVISLDLSLFGNVERAKLTGGAALRLTGNTGANSLVGNNGANVISGDVGADTIFGGGGADTIIGETGADQMFGGAGEDEFVLFAAADTGLATGTRDSIMDFQVGVDNIRIMFMDSFIGAAPFTTPGQVKYDPTTGQLTGNLDTDAPPEWVVQLDTGLALTAGDFVF